MSDVKLSSIVLACSLCVAAPCSSGSFQTKGGGTAWQANGLTACDKYLTAGEVAQILSHPVGHIEKRGTQGCAFVTDDSSGSIAILLFNAGPDVFARHQRYLVNPVALAGVGDKAVQSMVGIEAVKGTNRLCQIDAGGAPGSLRLRGPALGQKLGAICNQLFNLP